VGKKEQGGIVAGGNEHIGQSRPQFRGRSPDSAGARIHPFHDHWCRTPHFVVKIPLTYKSEFFIV
jgi:hypothetical protein